MQEILYWAMVAAFVTHELDAVKRHEWRILPVLSSLPERRGEQIFIWAHAPLLLVIFLASGTGANSGFALGLSGFAIVHVGLHWAYRRHPQCEFNNAASWSIIMITGVLGILHLLLHAIG